jgi:hypothetical protein
MAKEKKKKRKTLDFDVPVEKLEDIVEACSHMPMDPGDAVVRLSFDTNGHVVKAVARYEPVPDPDFCEEEIKI